MIYGYCRVSTKKQNIERQEQNIRIQYPSAVIMKEVYSRETVNRPVWQKLNKKVKSGDTIVMDSVSRMAGNKEEGVANYKKLYKMGVDLVFLNEPYINTSCYKNAVNKALGFTGDKIADTLIKAVNEVLEILSWQQVEKAFEQSEKELEDIRERTRQGIAVARENGKVVGRPAGSKPYIKQQNKAKAIIMQHCKEFGGSLSNNECMRLAGISKATFYKYKKELLKGPEDDSLDGQMNILEAIAKKEY